MAWFDWYGGRLEKELDSLVAAGFEVKVNEEAKAQSFVRLDLSYVYNGERFDLIALYPEFFPYFPPEVYSKSRFRRHQNPHSRNLCILGRRSEKWSSSLTLGETLPDALEAIIDFHKSGDVEDIRSKEEPQGEPISDYFNDKAIPDSLALFDSAWVVDPQVLSGWMEVEVLNISPPQLVVRRVSDAAGNELASWPYYSGGGKVKRIPWVRIRGTLSGNIDELQEMLVKDFSIDLRPNRSAVSSKHHFAVLYSEEVGHFEYGDGWTLFESGRAGIAKDGLKPIRTFRAGLGDLAARMPSVAALSQKTAAVVGLGAIGSQVAFELARNGIKEIHALDYDFVEPATVRRWVAGVPSFGKMKATAFEDIVAREYPTTKVVPHILKIGAFYDPPQTQYETLKDILTKADIVIDTSIEVGVNYLLSQMCWAIKKPYIIANSSPGAWGGRVIQFDQSKFHACWICYNADLEARPTNYEVPADPAGEIQPPGCAARTFTGTSFDLAEVAMEAVRVACGCLSRDEYPESEWQLALCSLRKAEETRQPPVWKTAAIARRPGCSCVVQ